MKIGDFEVPDSQVEDILKKSGKRVVENDDYIKKSEAAADLARFRAATGDSRSVEEIGAIIKQHEENEKKNKTQTELLSSEVVRLKKELERAAEVATKAQREVKIRDINNYFNQAQEALGLKVIDPILQEFRAPFYDLDETKISPDELKSKVNEAIAKATEKQNAELARLGLGSANAPGKQGESPFTGAYQKTPAGGPVVGDPWEYIKRTSTSPMGSPLLNPPVANQK